MRRDSTPGGRSLIVNFTGRGAVVWRAGRIRFEGPRCQRRLDLERAVEALFEMEGVDLSSAEQVRDALLTMGGARLVRGQGATGTGGPGAPATGGPGAPGIA